MSSATQQPDHAGADAIRAIRTLVEAQDLRAAKQQLRQLKTTTDDATWAMIVEIANVLRFKTHAVAVTKLRNLWCRNEQFRPLIEACVPKTGERQYIPEPSPRSFADDRRATSVQPGRVSQRVEADKRIEPNRKTRAPNTKVVEDYEKDLTKDEREDPGTPRAELILDRHDYDLDAAIPITNGLCVSCRLERAAIDRHTERLTIGSGDDGLCGECRSLDRRGIPELPQGHTLADQVHARLNFLSEHFDTDTRGIFRQEWRYADRYARPIISAWVKGHTNRDAEKDRQISEVPDLNDWCVGCGEYRQLADHGKKLCLDCDPRYRLTLIPAGSIEAQHKAYQREIQVTTQQLTRKPISTDAARAQAQSTNPQTSSDRQAYRETAGGERASSVARPSTRDAPAEVQDTSIRNAREATTAAQQRRRTISRRPGSTLARRPIR